MNKKEFIYILKNQLYGLSKEEIDEIIYDYEEHFSVGLGRGKTEDEISKELGDPKKIAKSYKANIVIENAQNNPTPTNIVKAVIATIALGLFNLIFVLGPFIGLVGVLIGLFGGALGVTFGGIGMFIDAIFGPVFGVNITININPIGAGFIGIGTTALGILFFILDIYLTKLAYKGTVKYLKYNIDIIKK
ncbi:HAAS signaling domain-containing protein [Tepidibacter sp. Z1-5]|uniref:HAAS signaling domain-containing protein n=1 Tax=Tepidibacter sp. Z1-5 TaxID=3134138 RepID=UPI0030BED903